MDSLDLLDCLGQLRLRILDDVAFIEDAVVPADVLQTVDIVPDDLVGCDHYVVGLELREELVTFPGVPGVEDWAQVLGVLEDLIVPVTSQSGRTDDERWKMLRVWGLGLFVLLSTLVMLASEDAY